MRDLTVVEVVIHGMRGYQIQGLWRACSDSLWETLAHAAIFRDRVRAERFLKKCRTKPSWEYNMKHWGVPTNHCISVVDAIQTPAKVYSVL